MTVAQLLAAALAGLGLGLALIVAIGAQNAFVLRQGIRREHVTAVVLVCIASDAVLITAGVAGAGALFTAFPWLVTVARWGGALFLIGYAALAARRALRRPDPEAEGLLVEPGVMGEPAAPGPVAVVTEARTLLPTVGTALALTWLNPHVYLDTVVLLGSVGSSHGAGRWAFAAGAVTGSVLWFTALGLAARVLAPVFARPHAWRVLDGLIAVVMTGLAAGLLLRT
ncbi:MAG: LysE/ArgO family amino acid transporter [Terracoccus sp.]